MLIELANTCSKFIILSIAIYEVQLQIRKGYYLKYSCFPATWSCIVFKHL